MPSKDHRVAARHAKLRERRKKQTREPEQVPTARIAVSPKEANSPSTITTPPPSQSRVRQEQSSVVPAVYAYVKGEVKRILVLSGAIVVILVVAGVSLT